MTSSFELWFSDELRFVLMKAQSGQINVHMYPNPEQKEV